MDNMNNKINKGIRGKITKIQLAYIAGLFDGEGHIFIQIRKCENKGKTQIHNLTVGITNTYRDVIEMIHETFGATRSIRIKHKNHLKWKPCYFWSISAKKAGEFLKLIYPYLIIKKEQAKLAIEFQENWRDRRFDKKGRIMMTTKEILKKREWYRQEISKLNHKSYHPQRLNEVASKQNR